MKWIVSLLIVFGALLLRPRDSRADEVTDGLARCWALLSTGNRDEACPCFATLEKAYPRPNVTLDRAKCEDRRGEVLEAVQSYERARLGYANTPDELASIDARLGALTPKLAKLVLDKGDWTRLEGLRISIDGVAIPLGERWMTPGTRKLSLDHAGKQLDWTVELKMGETSRFTVPSQDQRRALLPLETNAPTRKPVAPEDPESTNVLLPIGVSVLGVGVGGIVGAAVTGALILDAQATAESAGCVSVEEPDSGFSCPASAVDGRDAVETGASLVPVNYVMWGIAIAGVGAGIPLIIAGVAEEDVKVQAGLGSLSISGRF